MDLSSLGTALEWSPKGSPKRKNKPSFVRLSSAENECFSNLNAKVTSPFAKSARDLLNSGGKKGGAANLTPQKMMKSASSNICRSAQLMKKSGSVMTDGSGNRSAPGDGRSGNSETRSRLSGNSHMKRG